MVSDKVDGNVGPCSPGNGEWLREASRKLFEGLGVFLHSSPPESVSEQMQSDHNAWMTQTKGEMNPLEDLLLSSYLVGSLVEMDLESGLD